MRYDAVLTPVTVEALDAAIVAAYTEVVGREPSEHTRMMAVAHGCLECGLSPLLRVSKECWNNNPWNHKARADEPHCYRKCSENLTVGSADYQRAMAGSPRPTLRRPLYEEKVYDRNNNYLRTVQKASLDLLPEHPFSRFRHYDTLKDAAVDHMREMYTTFRFAFGALRDADGTEEAVERFALRLSTAGYYTAPISVYVPGLLAIWKELKMLSKKTPNRTGWDFRRKVDNETEADRFCRMLEYLKEEGNNSFDEHEKGTSLGQSTCLIVADAAEWNARLLPEDGGKVIPDGVADLGDYGKDMREGQNTIDHRLTYVAMAHDAWVGQTSPEYQIGPHRGCTYWQYKPGVAGTEHVVSVTRVKDIKVEGLDVVGMTVETIEGGQAGVHVQAFERVLHKKGTVWFSGDRAIKGWADRSETKVCGGGKWPYPDCRVEIPVHVTEPEPSPSVEPEPVPPPPGEVVDEHPEMQENPHEQPTEKRYAPILVVLVGVLGLIGSLIADACK